MSRPCIIGIAGPTCAGKSTLARLLRERLNSRNTAVISLDSYYRDLSGMEESEVFHHSFDRPESFDYELMLDQIQRLSTGQAIEKPVYQYPTHTRAESGELIEPGEYVIFEGLFALYWAEVRDRMRLRVFLEAPDKVCLDRRLARDPVERGFSPEFVRFQYESDVRPMYRRYVEPTRDYADLCLKGSDKVSDLIRQLIINLKKKCR